ncbi:MAG: WW domain-containing protein [Promethearchaeia archaeon]
MSALDSGDHASGDSSPLPVGWRKVHSRTKGRDYFVNESTGRSQWHPPDSLGQPTARGKALEPGPDGIVQHLRPRHSDTSGEEGPHADAATKRNQPRSEAEWQERATQAEAVVMSLSLDVRDKDAALREVERQLAHTQRSVGQSVKR